ncbi:MAG: ATP-binding cassette domain-containing protein [Oscillospiraceae bacterium]|nr:ATP-binding cassette domain-containing protein [Oscillospiraceae bacterium]
MTVLRTINLTKTYKQGSNYINAVDSVDFVVEKEQFVAITGASGSGKSTLLNLCAGIDKPSSGEVILDSVDISKLNSDELAEIRRNKIGFVFQQFNLLDIMTAKENIIIPSLLYNEKVDEYYFN